MLVGTPASPCFIGPTARSSGMIKHGATVHGGGEWPANLHVGSNVCRRPRISHSIHGATAFFDAWMKAHALECPPRSCFDSLDDDACRAIAQDMSVATVLAQCSKRLHAVMHHMLSRLVRIQETSVHHIQSLRRCWVHTVALTSDGHAYAICHSARECYVLTCVPRADGVCNWTRPPALAGLDQPTGAATHANMLLIADRGAMHTVHILIDGHRSGTLQNDTLRQPCAVAVDGVHAAVCGAGKIHLFNLSSRLQATSWPLLARGTTVDTTTSAPGSSSRACAPLAAFECEHGMALAGTRLYVCDQRGERVVVFDALRCARQTHLSACAPSHSVCRSLLDLLASVTPPPLKMDRISLNLATSPTAAAST